MTSSVLISTFLLTVLLAVGLFFFIRASIKDRTQTAKLISEKSQDSVLLQLQQYFTNRSYQVTQTNDERSQVLLEGFVRPSVFLAGFLTVLAAIGFLCLALVLSVVFPPFTLIWMGIILFAPLAGVFYWRGAGRPEKVLLKIEPNSIGIDGSVSVVTVTAHRDELSALQRVFTLTPVE